MITNCIHCGNPSLGHVPEIASPVATPRHRFSDAVFSALAAQAYPEVLDRETGQPWYMPELARRDAEIVALKARIVDLEQSLGE